MLSLRALPRCTSGLGDGVERPLETAANRSHFKIAVFGVTSDGRFALLAPLHHVVAGGGDGDDEIVLAWVAGVFGVLRPSRTSRVSSPE